MTDFVTVLYNKLSNYYYYYYYYYYYIEIVKIGIVAQGMLN